MTGPTERSIDDQAAAWALRFSGDDFNEQERQCLEIWLSESEAHRAAFDAALKVLRLTDAAAELEAEQELDRELEAARRERLQSWVAALAALSLLATGLSHSGRHSEAGLAAGVQAESGAAVDRFA